MPADEAVALKKILIVENERFWQMTYKRGLSGRVNILEATTIAQARKLLAENPDIALVIMDGCVDNNDDRFDTEELTIEIRKTFGGPMIAASGSEEYRDWLLEAGCNYKSIKIKAVQKVVELLNL